MEGPTRSMPLDELKTRLGSEIGVSGWYTLDQDTITKFADLTDDHFFLHTDPERAGQTPFGGTIAHGFLTLSMLAGMAYQAMPGVAGAKMGVNYGFNKIRFMAPVKAGKRVRGHFTPRSIETQDGGRVQIVHDVSVEIEGETKPAIIAEWVSMVWL